MALDNYGVIKVPNPYPTGDGGKLLIDNDKALNDARGVRLVSTGDYTVKALVSEVVLDFLENYGGASNTFGAGGVNLQSSVYSYGDETLIDGDFSTISGGKGNIASGDYSVVLGGQNNKAFTNYSIAGGQSCTATGAGMPIEDNAGYTISIGSFNGVHGDYSVALGGHDNYISGNGSVIICSFNSAVDAEHSVVVCGTESSVNTSNSCILCAPYSSINSHYSSILSGRNITIPGFEPYSISYGDGGNSSNDAGRFTIRGITTSSNAATTLILELLYLSSGSIALVDIDIVQYNAITTDLHCTKYLVKVSGTDVTVLSIQGDKQSEQLGYGDFYMNYGRLFYTTNNSTTVLETATHLRANLSATVMTTPTAPYTTGSYSMPNYS